MSGVKTTATIERVQDEPGKGFQGKGRDLSLDKNLLRQIITKTNQAEPGDFRKIAGLCITKGKHSDKKDILSQRLKRRILQQPLHANLYGRSRKNLSPNGSR